MIEVIQLLLSLVVIAGIVFLNDQIRQLRIRTGELAPVLPPSGDLEKRIRALEEAVQSLSSRVQENERLQQMIRVLAAK